MFFLYLFISVTIDDCTLYKFVLKKFLKIENKKKKKKEMDTKKSMQRSELFLVLTERKNDLPKQQPKTEGKSTSIYNLPKCFNLLVLK